MAPDTYLAREAEAHEGHVGLQDRVQEQQVTIPRVSLRLSAVCREDLTSLVLCRNLSDNKIQTRICMLI